MPPPSWGKARSLRTSREILLVGEHEQQCVFHFTVLDDPSELRAGLVDAVAVVGINDEDEALGAWSTSR